MDNTCCIGEGSQSRDKGENNPRLDLLRDRLNEIKGQLGTGNASIQKTVMATFQDESDLEAKLVREIDEAQNCLISDNEVL